MIKDYFGSFDNYLELTKQGILRSCGEHEKRDIKDPNNILDPYLKDIVQNLFQAYDKWIKVHKDIDNMKTHGNLSSEQWNDLTEAIEKKDEYSNKFKDFLFKSTKR